MTSMISHGNTLIVGLVIGLLLDVMKSAIHNRVTVAFWVVHWGSVGCWELQESLQKNLK